MGACPFLPAQEMPRAHFTEPEEHSVTVREGHLSLRWEVDADDAPGAWEYQLEQSFEEDFSPARTAYSGLDSGTFASGLPENGAYFRVRARPAGGNDAMWGPWSTPLAVAVNYPPMWQVALLGAVGIIMFTTLLIAIVIGSRRLSTSAT